MELLVQFLVLGATAALFWFARRDLSTRAAPRPPAAASPHGTEELEQLCATLEALVTDLSRRLSALESKSVHTEEEGGDSRAPKAAEAFRAGTDLGADASSGHAGPSFRRVGVSPPLPDPQYAPVYALMDAGIMDAQEVVRRTGLSRGEVELILSLRARQVL